jgi:type II secretory pathway pseudopilin PulG
MRIHHPIPGRAAGFTLIEVVLAIVIAVGLFTGVLVFYRQAATIREEILRKTDALSAVRLVMDRMGTELRTVPPATPGLVVVSGDSRSLRMIHTAVPSRSPWRGGSLGRAAFAEADWVEVTYRCSTDTNQPGLFRQERVHTDGPTVSTNLPTEIEAIGPEGTNALETPFGIPLSEAINHLRLRYWDGTRWLAAWEQATPPAAVEITLGLEPPGEDESLFGDEASPGEDPYPFEVFRRVVALPAAAPAVRSAPDPTEESLEEIPAP